ncbi:DUF3226 domain-containing protein [Thalassobellus sediminis]|uniref:DUF3226 domain-containing protein n=1 Tax=Thalassobellus sediminis TaxID=3367753 RepID=UPI00378837BF
MANNIILALCEGPHDVAFLHKILKTSSFKTAQNTKLGEYPTPMNQFIVEEVKKSNVNDLNIQTVRRTLLPGSVLKRDDNFVFLYALGGDSKKDTRQSILSKIVSFLPKEGKIEILPKDTTLNLLYFFDADDKGTENRLKEVQNEVKEIINDLEFLDDAILAKYREMLLGCYIFSNVESQNGKLEDLLIPIMLENNEEIFENAKQYFDTHYEEKRGKKKGADLKKAIIGISGQLQKSGSTNTVIISQSDYLNDNKIKSSDKCSEIISFFEKFTK